MKIYMSVIIKEFSAPFQQQVIDLILDIQQNEFQVPITLNDQQDLLNIPNFYQNGKGNFWIALNEDKVVGTTYFTYSTYSTYSDRVRGRCCGGSGGGKYGPRSARPGVAPPSPNAGVGSP